MDNVILISLELKRHYGGLRKDETTRQSPKENTVESFEEAREEIQIAGRTKGGDKE